MMTEERMEFFGSMVTILPLTRRTSRESEQLPAASKPSGRASITRKGFMGLLICRAGLTCGTGVSARENVSLSCETDYQTQPERRWYDAEPARRDRWGPWAAGPSAPNRGPP